MEVKVELFGAVVRDGPNKDKEKFRIELEHSATVDQLIKRIPLPHGVRLMVLINGQQAQPSSPLEDGDEVFLFSPFEGG